MNAHAAAYCSLGRIVLIPAYKEHLPGPVVDDPESLTVCPVSLPDSDLGAVVVRLLRDQRPRDFEMDFRGEAQRKRLVARRKLLCKAFGVPAVKGWLASATFVSIQAADERITASPLRRDGRQDAWSRRDGDPVGAASLSDPAEVGAIVRGMLALNLSAIR